jgi:N-acetyl sugar amidotransferase
MMDKARICSKCVMDTTDPDITFDAEGVCDHCRKYDELAIRACCTGEVGKHMSGMLVEEIRQAGKGRDYDCIIGLSGGVDSTFVAFKVKELGLRPLAVHLDNGWDSELAVKNIENVINRLKIDLHTHVIDWEEFRDLQLSFLKASTPDSEIPSDHAILALMHQMADKVGVKYIITGCNVRTETHLPKAWSQGHWDWKYIKAVHERFGSVPLKTFPHTDFKRFHRYILIHTQVDILNYLDYVKKDAKELIKREFGWKDYGGKHYESIYTRFYQGYILPRKFGYDKRKAHFSSLICSGEMKREEALEELTKEPYPPELQNEDKAYVTKKLGITEEEFEWIMNLPKKTYWQYPSYGRLFQGTAYRSALTFFKILRTPFRFLRKKNRS